MTTYGITYGKGAFLGPGNEPTWTETQDIDYFCSAFCATDVLTDVIKEYPNGDMENHAGQAWKVTMPSTAFVFVTETDMVSFGDMPCATSEVDYLVNCAGCGARMNGATVETLDTGRQPAELDQAEVVRWAFNRGMELNAYDHLTLMLAEEDDSDRLSELVDQAENHLDSLDGYHVHRDNDANLVELWSRDVRDPEKQAEVEL